MWTSGSGAFISGAFLGAPFPVTVSSSRRVHGGYSSSSINTIQENGDFLFPQIFPISTLSRYFRFVHQWVHDHPLTDHWKGKRCPSSTQKVSWLESDVGYWAANNCIHLKHVYFKCVTVQEDWPHIWWVVPVRVPHFMPPSTHSNSGLGHRIYFGQWENSKCCTGSLPSGYS